MVCSKHETYLKSLQEGIPNLYKSRKLEKRNQCKQMMRTPKNICPKSIIFEGSNFWKSQFFIWEIHCFLNFRCFRTKTSKVMNIGPRNGMTIYDKSTMECQCDDLCEIFGLLERLTNLDFLKPLPWHQKSNKWSKERLRDAKVVLGGDCVTSFWRSGLLGRDIFARKVFKPMERELFHVT